MSELQADNKIERCDVCDENRGERSMDVRNEKTGEIVTAWLCSECIRRTERYNAGDESAFDDLPTADEQE